MRRTLARGCWMILLLGLGPGCVSRSFTIETDPPGAEVYVSGKYLGKSPVTESFTFYGKREVVLRKEKYLAKIDAMDIRAPLYQRFPLDFFSEVAYPKKIRDDRTFRFALDPLPEESPETQKEIVERAHSGIKELSAVPIKTFAGEEKKKKKRGRGQFPYDARQRHWWHRR